MVIFVKLLQLSNALFPIDVTLSGNVILAKSLQLANIATSIVVTLLGIIISFKLQQSEKAPFFITVMLLGRVMFVKEVQLGYLQPIINQYFIGNKSEIWSLSLMVHSKRRRFNAFIDS